MAAIYFGSFSLAPQDAALSRQALFKLSFLHRYFLQPAGLRITVQRETALFSGVVTNRSLLLLGDILARQIEGIREVKDETETGPKGAKPAPESLAGEAAREAAQLLFATDQTLRSGVHLTLESGRLMLDGAVSTATQQTWAEHLVAAVGGVLHSRLKVVTPAAPKAAGNPPEIDDESLQALVLLRLRLVRVTEHLPLRVRANRGVISLQGKVRTEALRQEVENLTRSTLGLVELRSTLVVAP